MDQKIKKQLIPIFCYAILCLLFILLDFGIRVDLEQPVSMGSSYYMVESVPIIPSLISLILIIPLGWWIFFKRDNSDLRPLETEKFGKIMKLSLFLFIIILIFRQFILFYYHLPLEKTPIIYLIVLQIVITEGYFLKDFGLHRRDFWRNVFMAISALILIVIILVSVEVFIFFIVDPSIFTQLIALSSTLYINWIAMAALPFQILCVGIAEELFFRGYLFGKLDRSIGFLKAAVISSIIFSSFHLSWYIIPIYPFLDINGLLLHLAYTGIFGFVMCFIYKYSKSLVGPILLHGILNTAGSAIGGDISGLGAALEAILASYSPFQWILLVTLQVVLIGVLFILVLYLIPKYIKLFGINKESKSENNQ